jgi:hypothetical protein
VWSCFSAFAVQAKPIFAEAQANIHRSWSHSRTPFCYVAAMGEDKPTPETRTQALIAPLIVAAMIVALLIAVFLSGRKPPDAEPAPPPPPEPVAAAPAPALVKALSRRDLLERANLAAASAADGINYAAGESIVGRQFVMRIPFGCQGVGDAAPSDRKAQDESQFSVRYDPKKRALTLLATPSNWTGIQQAQPADAVNPVEHIEGFWVPKPWSFAETCNFTPPPAEPQDEKADDKKPDAAAKAGEGADAASQTIASPATQTLGFARMFRAEDSRVNRRDGRPYKYVIALPKDDDSALRQTYRLALEGRIDAFGDGAPLRCKSENGARPVCYYAVRIDRVAFESQHGAMLAEWRE